MTRLPPFLCCSGAGLALSLDLTGVSALPNSADPPLPTCNIMLFLRWILISLSIGNTERSLFH
jgi:hypothetical protein